MAYKSFRRIETGVAGSFYQKAEAMYLDHTSAVAIQWEDSNGTAFNITIPAKEIIPFAIYKLVAIGGGTLYILY